MDFKRTRTAKTVGSSATQTTSPTFGIYLVDTRDLLLSDQDIAAYVRATHEIKLNQSGIAKWNSHIVYNHSFDPPIPLLEGGLYQRDFAVRIDDKEIYRGKFWSAVSLQSHDES